MHITAGGGVNASTYNTEAFNITNTGTANITTIRVTTNSPFLPDLVFDPNGTAGDVSSDPKGFTADSGASETGLVNFSYQDPHNGVDADDGYDTLVVNFSDFESGESLTFSLDMDPTSIKGVSSPGPHESGAVSGLELSGTVVAIEYDNGSVKTVNTFSDGSPGGGQATVKNNTSAAPTLDVVNLSLESTTLSSDHTAATVSEANQTIEVTGPAGASVRLLRAESGLFLDGVPDGGYELEAYEANSVVQIEEYTATIEADGSVAIPVTLTDSVSANESGLNYFIGVIEDSAGDTGETSNVVVLNYSTGAPVLDPISDQTVEENTTSTVNVSASDPDGDPINLSASNLPAFASFTDNGDGTGNLTLSPQDGDAGTYELTVTASDGELTDSENVTVTVTENGTVLYRVNAGGSGLAAVDGGHDWEVDTESNPSPYHNSGSETSDYSDQTITVDGTVPSSTPPEVFDSARWDPSTGEEMQWEFPVESGTVVDVRLYFVDAFSGTSDPGDRVFDVAIENDTVLNDYDIVADVGPDTGTMKQFTVTSDGTVDVDFRHEVENPIVSGVEIVSAPPENDTLGASTDPLDFGSVTVNTESTESLQLTNLGADGGPDITINETTITGANASAFSDDFSGNVTLAPGESTTVNVTFAPESEGDKAADLEVTHTGTNSPLVVNLTGTGQSNATISFGSSDLSGVDISNPTSLDFGPDGRLYVATVAGTIYAYDVTRNDANNYSVTNTEVITEITEIPNHWDNGTLAPSVEGRQVTGILLAGTAENPVIYVSSSDPRIGGQSSGEDTDLDTNSGVISRLRWNGSAWEHVELVRGLPRSEENHAPNGMVLDEQNGTLYLAQGGNTGQGAPSNELAYLAEYAHAAAVLSINLTQVEAMPTKVGNDSGIEYKYDLPTLKGTSKPWGGEDGQNMAVFDADGPVQVYAPGFRNVYDLTLTTDGQMYGVDNGGSKGWGAPPVNEGPAGECTNEPNDGGEDDIDQLHLINEGFYGGHPNPTRGNPNGSGLYDENGNLVLDFNESYTPVPFDQAEDRQCDYLEPGQEDGALTTFAESTNGITEYTASNFNGAMQGDLLTVSFTDSGPVWRLQLNETGESIVSKDSLFSNFGSLPLDIVTQGDNETYPGTVWVANFGSSTITVFEPADVGECTGADDPSLDEDGDGYDNADEIDNDVDPCSAADTPPDWDGDLTSNLNDPDDDNDGIDDTTDAFQIDADNGLSTSPPLEYTFETGSEPGTLFEAGFTGVMTNGTDYLELYNASNVTATGIAGVLSIDNPDGDAASNTQRYGFQFGVNTSDTPFTIHTRIENAFEDNATTEDFQSTGTFIGTGDQDNYIKLVANADDGNVSLALAKEEAGSYEQVGVTQLGNASTLNKSTDLYLTVDPVNNTATAEYSLDNGATVETVAETSIVEGWHDNTSKGLAVGVIATHTGVSYQATWDMIEIDLAGNQPPSLDPIANQSVTEGETKSVEVTASDPDGDAINLSASNLPAFATFTDNGDGTGNLTLSPQDGDVGTYELTIEASDGNLTDSENVTVEVLANETVLYRVNAGGSGLAAVDDGPDWEIDTESNPSPYHNSGSETSDYSDQTIAINDSVPSSTPPEVFDSARWDPSTGEEMQWEFPVESGTVVEVRLYFVDAYSGTSDPGDRVFDVAIDDSVVLDDYDIVADVGPDTGTMKNFTVTSDDTVDIDFQHVVENPIVSGVEIVTTSQSGNQAPVLEPIANQTVEETETKTVNVSASDPDGDPINLSASNLPAFASFTDNGDGTGNLTLSPQEGDVGTYELTIEASDGNLTDSENLTVNVTDNQAPVLDPIANQTVEENTTSTVNVSASDPDGDPINLSASNLPAFVSFTDNGDETGNLTLSPQDGDAGMYELTIEASDGELSDIQNVTITVTENGTVLYRVNAGGSSLAAIDDGLDWEVDTASNPSQYHNSGSKTSDYSDQTITVDGSVPASTPPEVFDAARWDPSTGEEMQWAFPVESGTVVDVRLYFVDAYSGTSDPGDRVFDVAIENETVLNDYDIVADVGPDTGTMKQFTVTSDGTVDIDFQHVVENPIVSGVEIVSVDEPGNQSPVLGPIANQTVEETETKTVNVSASDPDGDPINLTASNLPAFASFTDNGDGTGNLTLSPQDGDVGAYELTIEASDGNLTDSENVTVNVTDNQAPVLDPIANQTVEENETTTVGVSASDPDGDPINLSASNLPAFATFTDNGDGTGNLTLSPQDGDAGTYELTIEASDGELSDIQNVTITVTENVTVLYRVNAGGSSLAAIDDGPDWDVDTESNPSPYHNSGSETSDYSDQTITVDGTVPSSTPPEVFDSARWDPSRGEEMQWAFPVENGTEVVVRLYFVDAYSGTSDPGDRVFDVAIDDTVVLDDYDIVADVGPDTGTMKQFTVTSDGTVDIDFQHVVENPIVSGVEIVTTNSTSS